MNDQIFSQDSQRMILITLQCFLIVNINIKLYISEALRSKNVAIINLNDVLS